MQVFGSKTLEAEPSQLLEFVSTIVVYLDYNIPGVRLLMLRLSER
jgi:hypothetical protein